MMNHQEVRRLFLDFFEKKSHKILPSSKIFLQDDPSLLFVNAGMNPFKNIFIGTQEPPYPRVTDSQKCLRVSGKHNDLDDVGVDLCHHTFFEMLGSWSFADYGKKEAIIWAWELVTEVYKLDKAKLWVTVFETDTESADFWKNETDIDNSRVLFFGEKENFWTMGNTGPCGPASEIHYDFGEQGCSKQGIIHNCSVNGDCGRYIELWNLVFMEFEQKEDGSLIPLANKYIDTGMGLERITRVIQNKVSNYDTDIFKPILDHIEKLSGKLYASSSESEQIAFRVIADHIRALCFAIADGVVPSNTGRGYVIRRILRRAYRYGQSLDMPEVFLTELAPTVISLMGEHYTELLTAQHEIFNILKDEEEKFSQTLEKGLLLFEKEVKKISGKVVPGTLAFLLFDTYGFPVDLTALLSKEYGLEVDFTGFNIELEKQKKLSKENQKFKGKKSTEDFNIIHADILQTEFVGYEQFEFNSSVITKYKCEDNFYQIVLDKTPFYAEGGGQISDTGILYSANFTMYVEDVQKTPKEYIHFGYIEGIFKASDIVSTKIDVDRRQALTKHHSGVHLIHPVLEKVLNRKFEFNSTYVAEDYFYCHMPAAQKLTQQEICAIEEEMNRIIQSCLPSKVYLLNSVQEANELGISSRFEDRLTDKDVTRVVEFPGVTTDLCGGTHVKNTGELGLFKILSDSSSGSNLRHIECVCGLKAWNIFNKMYEECRDISYEIKTSVKEVPQKAYDMLEEVKILRKDIKTLEQELSDYKYSTDTIRLLTQVQNIPIYFYCYDGATINNIQKLAAKFIKNNPESVIVLFTKHEGSYFYTILCKESKASSISMKSINQTILNSFSAKGGGKGHIFNGSFNTEPIGEIFENFIKSLSAI